MSGRIWLIKCSKETVQPVENEFDKTKILNVIKFLLCFGDRLIDTESSLTYILQMTTQAKNKVLHQRACLLFIVYSCLSRPDSNVFLESKNEDDICSIEIGIDGAAALRTDFQQYRRFNHCNSNTSENFGDRIHEKMKLTNVIDVISNATNAAEDGEATFLKYLLSPIRKGPAVAKLEKDVELLKKLPEFDVASPFYEFEIQDQDATAGDLWHELQTEMKRIAPQHPKMGIALTKIAQKTQKLACSIALGECALEQIDDCNQELQAEGAAAKAGALELTLEVEMPVEAMKFAIDIAKIGVQTIVNLEKACMEAEIFDSNSMHLRQHHLNSNNCASSFLSSDAKREPEDLSVRLLVVLSSKILNTKDATNAFTLPTAIRNIYRLSEVKAKSDEVKKACYELQRLGLGEVKKEGQSEKFGFNQFEVCQKHWLDSITDDNVKAKTTEIFESDKLSEICKMKIFVKVGIFCDTTHCLQCVEETMASASNASNNVSEDANENKSQDSQNSGNINNIASEAKAESKASDSPANEQSPAAHSVEEKENEKNKLDPETKQTAIALGIPLILQVGSGKYDSNVNSKFKITHLAFMPSDKNCQVNVLKLIGFLTQNKELMDHPRQELLRMYNSIDDELIKGDVSANCQATDPPMQITDILDDKVYMHPILDVCWALLFHSKNVMVVLFDAHDFKLMQQAAANLPEIIPSGMSVFAVLRDECHYHMLLNKNMKGKISPFLNKMRNAEKSALQLENEQVDPKAFTTMTLLSFQNIYKKQQDLLQKHENAAKEIEKQMT